MERSSRLTIVRIVIKRAKKKSAAAVASPKTGGPGIPTVAVQDHIRRCAPELHNDDKDGGIGARKIPFSNRHNEKTGPARGGRTDSASIRSAASKQGVQFLRQKHISEEEKTVGLISAAAHHIRGSGPAWELLAWHVAIRPEMSNHSRESLYEPRGSLLLFALHITSSHTCFFFFFFFSLSCVILG